MYTYTPVLSVGRYGDQFNQSMGYLTLIPSNDPNCERYKYFFYMEGHPPIRHHNETDVNLRNFENEKHMLMVETFQHSIEHNGTKIRLASVRYHQWLSGENDIAMFFDLVNPINRHMDEIFDYIQDSGLNLWDDRSDLDDIQFYEKLSDLVWLFAQASPLKDGSAATTEIIMKLCLIKRFPDHPPIFFTPGPSIDLIAMLSTRQDFRKIFKGLLRVEPATSIEIDTSRTSALSPLSIDAIEQHAKEQNIKRNMKQDIDKDLQKVGMFYRPDELLVLKPSLCSTKESVDLALRLYDQQFGSQGNNKMTKI